MQQREKNGRFKKHETKDGVAYRDTVLFPVEINLDLVALEKTLIIAPHQLRGFQIPDLGYVYAGPYLEKPSFIRGIKLAPEIKAEAQAVADIKDFGVPKVDDMIRLLLWAIKIMREDSVVYVGCMMGQGRTGTFLACLVKCFDIIDPIGYVRGKYNPHACETAQQEQFVADFPIDVVKFLLKSI